MRERTVGVLFILASALLFGINGSLSRQLFNSGVTPVTLVEFRMLVGGVCLLIFMLLTRRSALTFSRKGLPWLVPFGLSLALVTYTYFLAISRVPIAVVLVIQFSGSAWLALAGAIWRRRLPSWQMICALVLTIGGIVCLTGVWQASLNGLDMLGLLFSLFALIMFIIYLLLGKRIGQYLPALPATTCGAFVAALFWLIIQPPWVIPASTWNVHLIPFIVLVGIVGMALPFSLEVAGLRRLDATSAGIAATLELPASALIAYFWLGQALTLWQILGCALVLVGVIVVQLEQADKTDFF